MVNRKIKWLMYTVLVGLIPGLLRMLIWSILQNRNMDLFNASDFIVFGLILQISNINEIEHFNEQEKSWKTIQNGTSILFILFYGVLFTVYLLGQANVGLMNMNAIKCISMGLSPVSLLLSFSVYYRVSKQVDLP